MAKKKVTRKETAKKRALSTKKATPRKKATSRKKIMPAKKQQNKNWIITTSADRSIKDIAKDLEKAGFSVGHVNHEIQSISGAAGDEAVEKLRKVSGVIDVSPDQPIDIGPPDSPETW